MGLLTSFIKGNLAPSIHLKLQSVNTWLNSTKSFQGEKELESQDAIINKLADQLREVYAAETLRSRVIALENLVIACNKADCKDDELLEKIDSLKSQAISFLKAIFNVTTERDLKLKIADNERIMQQSKKRIAVQNFRVTPVKNLLHLKDQYRENDKKNKKHPHRKNKKSVTLLTESEREKFRVFMANGVIVRITEKKKKLPMGNNPLDDKTLHLKPFNTVLKNEKDGGVELIVGQRGDMYAGLPKHKRFSRSILLIDSHIFFIGRITTNDKGELIKIRDTNRYYKPNRSAIHNPNTLLEHLCRYHGAISYNTKIKLRTFNSKKANYTPYSDIEDVQSYVIDKINPKSKLPSCKQWQHASDGGFFAKRPPALKKVDEDLQLYRQFYNIRPPKKNIKLLREMIKEVNLEKENHPDSKRKSAETKFVSRLEKEITFWEKKNKFMKKKASTIDDGLNFTP